MSQEYPLIKIQDMNSGDIVLDEKNEKMVVYVNSTCSLFTKDGMQHDPKPASQYRLVQKKRFACPLNHVFYITEKSAALSFENREMWYQECAVKGIEPKVKRTVLAIPDCQKPVAAFQSFSEAVAYKAKQDEPQWFVIYKDERGLWALTKSHVVHPDIEVVDETRLLKDKIDCLELDHRDLIHELTRLRGLDDENEDLFRKNTELEGAIKIAKARIEELEKEKAILSKNIGGLVDEVLDLRLALKDARIRIEDNRRDYSQVLRDRENTIEDLEIDLEASKKELELLKADKKEIKETHASEVDAMRKSLKATREQYEESLAEAISKFMLLTKENEELKDRVVDLMEKIKELKGSLQVLETKRVQLQYQLEREKGVSTKWQQEAVACREEFEKLSALVNLHA